MKYFFVLGNNEALSVAELLAYYAKGIKSYYLKDNILLLDTQNKINLKNDIRYLGGTIKAGCIENEINNAGEEKIIQLAQRIFEPKDEKFNFAFSVYGKYPRQAMLKRIAMRIKKDFRQKGFSSRWVVGRERALSSVIVEQNKLISGGAEIVLIKKGNKVLLGRTKVVQVFKELSWRDYGRPKRDDKSGMIPPKLAQIMLNLALVNKKSKILDPFCGSGTILMEASLFGIKEIFGCDQSKTAIKDSRDNLQWLSQEFGIDANRIKLNICDARELSREFAQNSLDAVISEPYLGPQRGEFDLKKTMAELTRLYEQSLNEIWKIIKPSGHLVMVWPIRFYGGKKYYLAPKIEKWEKTNCLPPALLQTLKAQLSPRQTFVYGRKGQKVWREIVVLTKARARK